MQFVKTYKEILLCTALSCFFFIKAASQTEDPVYSQEIEKEIKQVENSLAPLFSVKDSNYHLNLLERMKIYKVNGVSIAVIHDYKLRWARGYGWADLEEKRPVTTHTLFQAASISKSLNAVGVLKLVQEGKLNLNTDINKYLKSWQFPYDSVSKNKVITISQLLSHTAGLGVHGFYGIMLGDSVPGVIQILEGHTKNPAVRSKSEPGLKYNYSGGGVLITQLIITDQTGEAYDKYEWENVLEPLGMTESFFSQPPPSNRLSILASGYNMDGPRVNGKFRVYLEMAPAGLWTNPTDLAKFITETQLSYEGKSGKLLTEQMTKTMLTVHDSASHSALGVFVLKKGDRLYFGHDGVNLGFSSIYYGSLEGGDGVVVMINQINDLFLAEVVNSVTKIYGWKEFHYGF